jgi:hypothetical protein
VVEKHTSRLLGYERRVGPELLRCLVQLWLGHAWYISWTDVAESTEGRVVTSVDPTRLTLLEQIARY